MGLTKFALLVENEDYHLYSVLYKKKQALLKVVCDPDLFYREHTALTRLGSISEKPNHSIPDVTLRLKEYYTFATPIQESE